ncbi:MAG TPA: hypothetical protein EYM29_09505 [Rhodospirillales bacterium]|nr:hypothetical protein [Rhodospirillales bacterium]
MDIDDDRPGKDFAFQFTQGELKTYVTKSDTGRAKLGAFCPGCGTRIYHKPEWRKSMLSVRAGTLDDTSLLKPDLHIWTGSYRRTNRDMCMGIYHHTGIPLAASVASANLLCRRPSSG